MNKNNNLTPSASTQQSNQLRSIAGDLMEVHGLLSLLCNELGGGGIVQARHLEPMLSRAVPKLRDAVQAMNEISGPQGDDSRQPNPLLM